MINLDGNNAKSEHAAADPQPLLSHLWFHLYFQSVIIDSVSQLEGVGGGNVCAVKSGKSFYHLHFHPLIIFVSIGGAI